MGRILGLRHPFFRQRWRRVLTVLVLLAWAIFEFANGATVWASLFGGLGLVAAWEFFVVYDPANYTDKDDPQT